MKRFLQGIYYSFPLQLMILHLRSNLLLMLIWLIPIATISGNFGKDMGFHYFFLDPEYMGKVSFWSFFWIGISFGVFYIAWNTTTYILNSYRFPFLASLSRPFAKYSFNNLLLPFLFIIFYLYNVINFQWYNEFTSEYSLFFYCLGFLSGLALMLFVVVVYFYTTNKDIATFQKRSPLKVGQVLQSLVVRHQERELEKIKINPYKDQWRVDFYLTEGFRVRIVRDVRHYNFKLLERVFRQNHLNALVIQTLSITAMIMMSALVEYQQFRIPTSASMLLLLSIFTTIIGALTYWLREWRTMFIIALLMFIDNVLLKQGILHYENQAYGLNYTVPRATYSYERLDSMCNWEQYRRDIKGTLDILENWRNKFYRSELLRKPRMVVLCVSGGGLRASLWTSQVIRELDKQLGGRFFDHTILITGASGGMLGAAYYRELFHQKKLGKPIDLQDDTHLENVAKDLANALSFTFVVNDVFVPWVSREVNGYTYKQDRGYMFEQQYIENTDGLMGMDINYYREPEQKGIIPMMFLSPIIINDGRFLYITPHRVSYMMKPPFAFEEQGGDFAEIDGVDFGALFDKQNPYNMRFATGLRMNATYPFILPNVSMPSEPSIDMMDAGFRDNFGLETSSRFLMVFRNWIRENTSGVVILQIRAHQKVNPIPKKREKSIGNLFSPVAALFDVDNLQDFHHDNYIANLKAKMGSENVELVRFSYRPNKLEQKASMSLHLTQREKNDILSALYLEDNQKSLQKVKELVK